MPRCASTPTTSRRSPRASSWPCPTAPSSPGAVSSTLGRSRGSPMGVRISRRGTREFLTLLGRRQPFAERRSAARERKAVRDVRVAFDITPLRLTRAGTARYIQNVLPRLDGVDTIEFGGSGRASVLARELWWYPFRLSTLAGYDLLHCTTYYAPLRPRTPTVATVHDLAVLRYPEAFPRWTRNYVPRVVPRALRAARRVIAVSAFTAGELERLLGIPRETVAVVPHGIDAVFTAEGPRSDGDYVLVVGTLEPRKNLRRAIEAAKRLGVELRVAGVRGWGGVDPGIHWQGRP